MLKANRFELIEEKEELKRSSWKNFIGIEDIVATVNVIMRKICILLFILVPVCVLIGCEQGTETTDSAISNGGNVDMNDQLDFDRENSINQIREVLETAEETAESWQIEIIVNVLEMVGVRGVVRAEFIEQPSGNLPAVPILEIESEDNRIYFIHLSGGNIITISCPENGIIYEAISPMID